MNKEAKIGLTIILVLMVTFIAVVAKRLYSSRAAEQVSAGKTRTRKDRRRRTRRKKKHRTWRAGRKIQTYPPANPG